MWERLLESRERLKLSASPSMARGHGEAAVTATSQYAATRQKGPCFCDLKKVNAGNVATTAIKGKGAPSPASVSS
jgi:hypothetical protein